MKRLLTIVVMLVALVGCSKDDEPKKSTYPNLNGSYTYSYYKSWNSGIYEESDYDSWDFDNTNKAWHYSCHWSYTVNGWNNALKESWSGDEEWKVEGNYFKSILWDNEFSSWGSHTFEYISSTSFKMDGHIYLKD